MTVTEPFEHPELEDRLGGAMPFEAFQERSPADVAEEVRFLCWVSAVAVQRSWR